MDPLDKEKLDKALALLEENNTLLRKMRASQKNAQLFKALYWAVIIFITIGGYYALKPILSNLGSAYGITPSGDTEGSQRMNIKEMQQLLKDFQQ